MKIAITTDDNDLVNGRFGCAYYFQVFHLTNGAITARELVEKLAHLTVDGCPQHCDMPRCFTPDFLNSLKQYDLIVSGGIRANAWKQLQKHDMPLILTSLKHVDDVIEAYQAGTLEHEPDLIQG